MIENIGAENNWGLKCVLNAFFVQIKFDAKKKVIEFAQLNLVTKFQTNDFALEQNKNKKMRNH